MKSLPGNEEIASILYLEAPKLVEDHERGRLKGRLKAVSYTHLDVYKRQVQNRVSVLIGKMPELGIPYQHTWQVTTICGTH